MQAQISNIRTNIMGTVSFDMIIAGMRKPQDFIVYPIEGTEDKVKLITIQSDKRIAQLDPRSGKGVMSQNHANGAYFMHLQFDTLIPFTLSEADASALRLKIFTTADPKAGIATGIYSDNSGAVNIFDL